MQDTPEYTSPHGFRCGFVALAGRPNVGKSTLLNALVGQHLSIVSPKAQTTRERVPGIVTGPDFQMLFIDAPGLIDPGYALQEAMRATAEAVVAEADVVIYIVDATRPNTLDLELLAETMSGRPIPVLVVVNKSDAVAVQVADSMRGRAEEAGFEALAVSALTRAGLDNVLEWTAPRLPHSPPLFPTDESATQPVRFFAQEYVRETCMDALREEVPYSIICQVDEFREAQDPVYISITIYVERESQKGIVIGRGGSTIRQIGSDSRQKIEELIGQRVYLDLRVKLMPDWPRKRKSLKRFGFQLPPEA
ncbi:MAG TPA: GTPase Era [Gemmatimonadota bacterium]|nr:GTPase Era [Gemmatimonadota bacterium]